MFGMTNYRMKEVSDGDVLMNVFSRFDMAHKCDRQTDGETVRIRWESVGFLSPHIGSSHGNIHGTPTGCFWYPMGFSCVPMLRLLSKYSLETMMYDGFSWVSHGLVKNRRIPCRQWPWHTPRFHSDAH